MNNTDPKYLEALKDIKENGVRRSNRTQFDTFSKFGMMIKYDLSEGFPLLTSRKITFKIAAHETLMFLKGITDTKYLEEKGIYIWKGNTSREFLDDRGLEHLPEGDMGSGYGYQWRKFSDEHDQISELLINLKKDPQSRRHLVTAWNPHQLDDIALPPCHILHQYWLHNGKLSCMFTMRSNDFYHGHPYNIAQYALLTHIFAKYIGAEPGELVFSGADVHIYENQLSVIEMQLNAGYFELPTLEIKKDLNSIDDVFELEYEDFVVKNYSHNGRLPKVQMAV